MESGPVSEVMAIRKVGTVSRQASTAIHWSVVKSGFWYDLQKSSLETLYASLLPNKICAMMRHSALIVLAKGVALALRSAYDVHVVLISSNMRTIRGRVPRTA